MLLDPFEEQLYMPTTAIQIGNGPCGQGEVVGQECETYVVLCVVVFDLRNFDG